MQGANLVVQPAAEGRWYEKPRLALRRASTSHTYQWPTPLHRRPQTTSDQFADSFMDRPARAPPPYVKATLSMVEAPTQQRIVTWLKVLRRPEITDAGPGGEGRDQAEVRPVDVDLVTQGDRVALCIRPAAPVEPQAGPVRVRMGTFGEQVALRLSVSEAPLPMDIDGGHLPPIDFLPEGVSGALHGLKSNVGRDEAGLAGSRGPSTSKFNEYVELLLEVRDVTQDPPTPPSVRLHLDVALGNRAGTHQDTRGKFLPRSGATRRALEEDDPGVLVPLFIEGSPPSKRPRISARLLSDGVGAGTVPTAWDYHCNMLPDFEAGLDALDGDGDFAGTSVRVLDEEALRGPPPELRRGLRPPVQYPRPPPIAQGPLQEKSRNKGSVGGMGDRSTKGRVPSEKAKLLSENSKAARMQPTKRGGTQGKVPRVPDGKGSSGATTQFAPRPRDFTDDDQRQLLRTPQERQSRDDLYSIVQAGLLPATTITIVFRKKPRIVTVRKDGTAPGFCHVLPIPTIRMLALFKGTQGPLTGVVAAQEGGEGARLQWKGGLHVFAGNRSPSPLNQFRLTDSGEERSIWVTLIRVSFSGGTIDLLSTYESSMFFKSVFFSL